MKKRDIAISIILTIVTCGIYGLYWCACLNDELKHEAKEDGFTSGGMVVLLSIVTCGIYTIYWSYKMGEFVNKTKKNTDNTGILYLILSLIGFDIVVYALIQNELNKKIEEK
ncbi:MAG: DUF4234 domain-containing protein [Bacilli bacterium]|nr:DUF4234 domain-containing protein [Bacilli bacterium]